MGEQRQLFVRAWIVAFILSLAIACGVLRPDTMLRSLWHLRYVDMTAASNELSDRALRGGSQLRAVAPDAPAAAEKPAGDPGQLPSLGSGIIQARHNALRGLAVFFGIMVLVPLVLAALSVAVSRLIPRRVSAFLHLL